MSKHILIHEEGKTVRVYVEAPGILTLTQSFADVPASFDDDSVFTIQYEAVGYSVYKNGVMVDAHEFSFSELADGDSISAHMGVVGWNFVRCDCGKNKALLMFQPKGGAGLEFFVYCECGIGPPVSCDDHGKYAVVASARCCGCGAPLRVGAVDGQPVGRCDNGHPVEFNKMEGV